MRLILLTEMEMPVQSLSEAKRKEDKATRLLNDPALVDWLTSYAHHLCYKSGLQEADADDLVQESFQKAVVAIDAFRHDAKREPWLKSILINAWRDLLRKKKREHLHFLGDHDGSVEQVLDQTDAQHVVDIQMMYLDLQDRISAALHELKSGHRMALLFLIMEGLSYQEIAERMGIQQNQVKGIIFQARRKFGN